MLFCSCRLWCGWLWLICDLLLGLLANCGCVGCLVYCVVGVGFVRFCCGLDLFDLLVYFCDCLFCECIC